MQILLTNDDGIQAESLWALARELKKVGSVTVIAPDGERSAIGTAVNLFRALHVQDVCAPVDGVKALSCDGSPSDCVILALGKLVEKADIVVSGVNPNVNLGEDVYISGTVGAAMQGYFRGLPALAVSAPPGSRVGLGVAAQAAAVLAGQMVAAGTRIFLNVNAPDRPPGEVEGVRITRLARASHINSVAEEPCEEGKQYRLVRTRQLKADITGTDIEATDRGYISVTPLYTSLLDKPPQPLLKKLCAGLAQELKLEFK